MRNGIGGTVEAFGEIGDLGTLKKFLEWAGERNIEYRYIGSGSKSIIREGGMRGVLIRPVGEFSGIDVDSETDEEVILLVNTNTKTKDLVGLCVEKGCSGLEGMYIYGGTVGGCLSMNVKLASGTLADFVEEITIINREMKELTLRGKSLRFEESRLKIPRTACISRMVLKLKRTTPEEVEKFLLETKEKYGDLSSGEFKCLVGVFKDAEKTKAEDLIYDAGLVGIRIGGARVMSTHPNAFINEANATAKNVMVLMNLVKDRVKQSTGILLEPAINIMGDRA